MAMSRLVLPQGAIYFQWVCCLCFCITFAYFYYLLIEKPFLKMSKKIHFGSVEPQLITAIPAENKI